MRSCPGLIYRRSIKKAEQHKEVCRLQYITRCLNSSPQFKVIFRRLRHSTIPSSISAGHAPRWILHQVSMYPLGIAILSQGDMLGATVVEVLPSCAQLVFGQTRLGRLLSGQTRFSWVGACFPQIAQMLSLDWSCRFAQHCLRLDNMRPLYFSCCCTCQCWSTRNKHQNKQTNGNHGGAQTVLFLVSARIPGQRQAAWNEGREARASENH